MRSIFTLAALFLPAIMATPLQSRATSLSGKATHYGGNVQGGMCSFSTYKIPAGIGGTALSDVNWDGARACGRCLEVTGPQGNKVKVMVVDQCPGCGPNAVDLFQPAFSTLAPLATGIITASWTPTPCGIETPLILKNKSGTSPYWFSMQVLNANIGVSTLEVSTDGGKSWKPTKRQPYNFFEQSAGFGVSVFDVRVTGVDGQVVVVRGVGIEAEKETAAAGNFA